MVKLDEIEKVSELIKSLDKNDSLITALFFVEECTPKEISQILDLDEDYVEKRIEEIIKKISIILNKNLNFQIV